MSAELVTTTRVSEASALIAEIRRLKAEIGCNLWKMGCALRTLNQHSEWWKPTYRSWDAFTRAELALTGGYCLKLIDVATEFTERQVIECGAANLIRILPVPRPERRPFLRLAAKSNQKTVRAAVNYWAQEKAAHNQGVIPARHTGRPGNYKQRKVHTHLGADELHIALYAGSPDSTKRSKRIEDHPVGRALLGGKMWAFALRCSDAGLVIIARQERPEMPDIDEECASRVRDEEE